MNIIIIFGLFSVVFVGHDHVEAQSSTDECDALPSSRTVKKSGRKALDKCIEYQETLVYPCEQNNSSTSLAGGQKRANHCQIDKMEPILGNRSAVPHMVMLGFGKPLHRVGWLCGATLLSENYILAPANCKDLFGEIPVSYAKIGTQNLFDSSPEKVFKVKSVTVHPGYRPGQKYNDIALYELDKPVTLNSNIVPACLPIDDNLKDDRVLFSYWNAKNVFQKRIRNKSFHEDCSKKFPPSKDLETGVNSTTQVCYEDITYSENGNCVDTLGGPVQVLNTEIDCMYTVTGIAGFTNGCLYEVYVFTRIGPYVPWIESVVWPSDPKPSIITITRTETSPKKEKSFGTSSHGNRNFLVFLVLSIINIIFY